MFARKAFLRRQERLLRRLFEVGLAASEICSLRIADLRFHENSCFLQRASGETVELGSKCLGENPWGHRLQIGLSSLPADPLIVDTTGQSISVGRLEAHFQMARTVRLSMESNGALCRALLAARSELPDIPNTEMLNRNVHA
jgi:hypothetical protein